MALQIMRKAYLSPGQAQVMPVMGPLYQHEPMVATYLAPREAYSGAQNFVRGCCCSPDPWEVEKSPIPPGVSYLWALSEG